MFQTGSVILIIQRTRKVRIIFKAVYLADINNFKSVCSPDTRKIGSEVMREGVTKTYTVTHLKPETSNAI